MIDQKNNKDSSDLKFDSKFYKYVLFGDPTFMGSPKFFNSGVGDISKRNKTKDTISLESQHNAQPYLKPPLKLQAYFYFHIPMRHNSKLKNYKPGRRHIVSPNLFNCVKYLEDISRGIIFQDAYFISEVEAHKVYDDEPRVEFYIVELK